MMQRLTFLPVVLALSLAGAPTLAQTASSPAPATDPAGTSVTRLPELATPARDGLRDHPGSAHAAGHETVAAEAAPSLPPETVTRHVLALPDRTLRFTASVGVLPLRDPHGATRGELGITAFTLDDADPGARPVTFVINGGPGMASAWLQLGVAGPWRLPLAQVGTPGTEAPAVIASSTPPVVVPNAETWLDFTDLVFVDPPGTGYAPVEGDDTARKRLWSVDGDLEALATGMHLWLARAGRMASPKIIAGESYGGFRAPRLVRVLAQDGVGIGGLVLVSPALDLGGVFSDGLMSFVARLPAEAAAERERHGPIERAALAEVEAYATGDYLAGLVAGQGDPALLDRLSAKVAALTGLDPALVRRLGGRVGTGAFLREEARARARVGSAYDASVTEADPDPLAYVARYPDPVLDALVAPVSSAMEDLYGRQLGWRPEVPYVLFNRATIRQWDWGGGLHPPEAMDALRTALALDPQLHVVVAHGLTDLVCPYFGSVLLLRQLPLMPDRLRLVTYPGGHMFYTRDASRAELRAQAQWVISRQAR